MATAERSRPPIVVGDARETDRIRLLGDHTARNAARALWAIGLLFLLGSLADLALGFGIGAEWGNPNWELTLLSNSLEGTPRIPLAVALIWAALYIRGSNSLLIQRVFGIILIGLGVAAAFAGAVIASDYFVMREALAPEQRSVFLTVVLKALTLSMLHLIVLVPVGVLSVRRPRG